MVNKGLRCPRKVNIFNLKIIKKKKKKKIKIPDLCRFCKYFSTRRQWNVKAYVGEDAA